MEGTIIKVQIEAFCRTWQQALSLASQTKITISQVLVASQALCLAAARVMGAAVTVVVVAAAADLLAN